MTHARLYNTLRADLYEGSKEDVLASAQKLHDALKDSMMTYGWARFDLTGDKEIDEALKNLDRYLTGERNGQL